jgi:hypothetical protein
MSEPKCPKCGGNNLLVERRPDGDARCLDCDWLGKYSECFKVDPKRYQQEIERLKQRLAEAEKALEWYANEVNWDAMHDSETFDCIDEEDQDRDEDGVHWGGKRAREYFRKWRTSAEGE